MNKTEIAKAFSNGQFEKLYPYFSDKISWDVVGENSFAGKEAVVQNCEQTAAYFKSVTTNFRTENIVVGDKCVAIDGTAEFLREGKRIAFVQACDVYNFNERHELEKITSYCIQDKK